ncbi:hypothetical protein QDX25_07345 [Auritidibacter ignavus]|uniref:hypothetical protein n=1 Tax=Auritidibacter ignavus TaxID=678932 RepID=UPI00244C9A13|nr:hypothetical protein [Auritidibacter ignavus]WGH80623.1 hypothetical protein QDX25_07345 [Auritidibacter ignavus]
METLSSLADIVEIARRKHGTSSKPASGVQLSRIAQKQGFKITYTTINHIAAGTYKYNPSDETIRALAGLAGVSDEVAFRAAGKTPPGPPLADELPPGSDNLSPRSRAAVIDMLRTLIDLEQRSGIQDTSAEVSADAPASAPVPPPEALAAHPEMRLAADDEDAYFDTLGEENQDEDE